MPYFTILQQVIQICTNAPPYVHEIHTYIHKNNTNNTVLCIYKDITYILYIVEPFII